VEVWYTSNLGWLRLGETKKEDRRRQKKPQGKNIMSASAMQGGHKQKTEATPRLEQAQVRCSKCPVNKNTV